MICFFFVVQRVEGVEKLLLHRVFARDEVDVVDQKHVHVAVFFLKRQVAVLPQRQRVDELVGEFLAGDVEDVEVRVQLSDLVHNREQQVRFAQPRRAEEEQRVVQLGRMLRHRVGGGLRELVGRADDEVVERVFAAQVRTGGRLFLRGRVGTRGRRAGDEQPLLAARVAVAGGRIDADLDLKAEQLLEHPLDGHAVAVERADRRAAEPQAHGGLGEFLLQFFHDVVP